MLCPICRTPVPADLKINFTIRDLALALKNSQASGVAIQREVNMGSQDELVDIGTRVKKKSKKKKEKNGLKGNSNIFSEEKAVELSLLKSNVTELGPSVEILDIEVTKETCEPSPIIESSAINTTTLTMEVIFGQKLPAIIARILRIISETAESLSRENSCYPQSMLEETVNQSYENEKQLLEQELAGSAFAVAAMSALEASYIQLGPTLNQSYSDSIKIAADQNAVKVPSPSPELKLPRQGTEVVCESDVVISPVTSELLTSTKVAVERTKEVSTSEVALQLNDTTRVRYEPSSKHSAATSPKASAASTVFDTKELHTRVTDADEIAQIPWEKVDWDAEDCVEAPTTKTLYVDESEEVYESIIKAQPTNISHKLCYARFLQAKKDMWPKAQILFEDALKLDPKHPEVLYYFGRFYEIYLKNNETAGEMYRRAIEEDPVNANALYYYARLLHLRKDYATAENYYKKALVVNPKHIMTLASYARLLEYIYLDYDRAEELYMRAANADVDEVQNLALTGFAIFLYTIRKDGARADDMFHKSFDVEPNDSYTLASYAEYAMNFKQDFLAAETYFHRSITIHPRSAATLASYAHFLATIRRDYDGAEVYYSKAYEVDPQHTPAVARFADFKRIIRQDSVGAEKLYKEVLAIDAFHPTVLIGYGTVMEEMHKDYVQADHLYNRGIHADPKSAEAWYAYAKFVDVVKQDYASADKLYRKALEVGPRHAITHFCYANFLIAQKDLRLAEQHYKKSLECADRMDPTLLFRTCMSTYATFLYAIKRDADGAELLFKQLLDLDSTVSLIMTLYAELLVKFRRSKEDTIMRVARNLWMRVLSIKKGCDKAVGGLEVCCEYEIGPLPKCTEAEMAGVVKQRKEQVKQLQLTYISR